MEITFPPGSVPVEDLEFFVEREKESFSGRVQSVLLATREGFKKKLEVEFFLSNFLPYVRSVCII